MITWPINPSAVGRNILSIQWCSANDSYDDNSGIDEDDGIHLIFGDNEGMLQSEDDPRATATLPDQLDVLDDPVDGRNSDLVQNCFTAAPVFDFHQYREPGTITCNGAGPLPLQDFISQRAPTLLA